MKVALGDITGLTARGFLIFSPVFICIFTVELATEGEEPESVSPVISDYATPVIQNLDH